MARWTDYTVRYIDDTKASRPNREKSFTSEDARAAWIDKNVDGIEVLAFSDPQ